MSVDIATYVHDLAVAAKAASASLATASDEQRQEAVRAMAAALRNGVDSIVAANELDMSAARDAGTSAGLLDRLLLTPERVEGMAAGLEKLAELPDPVGRVLDHRVLANGVDLTRVSVPLGLVAMVYEARPNVTADAAGICIRTGNACILRGGSEAFETNRILGELVQQALTETGLPTEAVQIAPTTDRDFVGEMIRANKYIDVIIPRGGKGLIARLAAEATVPMIHHLDGICHTYVDKDADIDMAVSVTDNAKTQRYSPCNATETLLVHEAVADVFLPRIGRIFAEKNVEMRCDAKSKAVLEASGLSCVNADPSDWDTEYNAPIISIAVVESLDEAIAFIEEHSSKHTDAIITNNLQASQRFLREVDSGSVMVNCSTRFADGFEYGLGAEIGISTGKLHARGPVGLEGLTSLKYVVIGNGEGRH